MSAKSYSDNAASGPSGSPVPIEASLTGFQDVSGNLINVSAANPLPVTSTGGGGGGVVTQASGANLHVDVDNFPATQPVSLATAPSTPVTNANLDVALSTRTKPSDQQHVIIDTIPSTAVTGPLTDTQMRASAVPVSLATAPSTPVTNAGLTNLDVALSTRTKPADQQHVIIDTIPSTAVTNAGLTNLDVALSTRLKPADTLAAVTSITNAVTVAQATAASLNATVVGPTLTKGTQGAAGFSVQDLKDSGRVPITFYVDAIAGLAVEALVTMNITKGLVAQTAATSYTVTAGKTLRLQSISASIINSAATNITSGKVRVRAATASFTVASAVLIALDATPPQASTALIGSSSYVEQDFPDGIELASANILGMSDIFSSATGSLTVCLVGYEY